MFESWGGRPGALKLGDEARKTREKLDHLQLGKVILRTKGSFKMSHLTQVCNLFSSIVS